MHRTRSSIFRTSIGALSRFACSLRNSGSRGFKSFKDWGAGFGLRPFVLWGGPVGKRSRWTGAFGAFLFLLGSVSLATNDVDWPFEPFRRVSDTPILSPRGKGWESAGTFNPAVVIH